MSEAPIPEAVMHDAVAWAVRVNDPAFAEWEAFEAWLGADAIHAAAYHEVSLAEAEAISALTAAPPRPRALDRAPDSANDVSPPRRRWASWGGGAVAASALVALLGHHLTTGSAARVYETAPGVSQTIALADGSSMVLNGGSRVTASDARTLTLERGEALFTVRHDASRPFRVAVGGASVTDVGTRFDLVRQGGETRVAVAEGAVDWQAGGDPVRIDAGHGLRAVDGAGTVVLASLSTASIGGWAQGQLSYDGTPLATVAEDLGRALGVPVTVAPPLGARPVRGVLRLDGGAGAVMPRAAALLGLRAEKGADGKGWRLIAPS